MDRTITVRILTADLPESIRGVTEKTGQEKYVLLLNGEETDPETIGTFIHEMLHIYHDDCESSLPAELIEKERRRETVEICEKLKNRL